MTQFLMLVINVAFIFNILAPMSSKECTRWQEEEQQLSLEKLSLFCVKCSINDD